jgi:arylsulfatase A-like enzyme
MIEYLDGEVGRLLAGVNLEDVTVLVLSDNGSPPSKAMAPNTAEHAKFTAYRGGVETTAIVAGYAVRRAIAGKKNYAGQELTGHAHAVDFYKTALRLCPGPDPGGWPAADSLALYTAQGKWVDPPRSWNFTELAEPLGVPPGGPYTKLSRAVESGDYKAVWDETGAVELYDVTVDQNETLDLLADGIDAGEQAALDGMAVVLGGLGL